MFCVTSGPVGQLKKIDGTVRARRNSHSFQSHIVQICSSLFWGFSMPMKVNLPKTVTFSNKVWSLQTPEMLVVNTVYLQCTLYTRLNHLYFNWDFNVPYLSLTTHFLGTNFVWYSCIVYNHPSGSKIKILSLEKKQRKLKYEMRIKSELPIEQLLSWAKLCNEREGAGSRILNLKQSREAETSSTFCISMNQASHPHYCWSTITTSVISPLWKEICSDDLGSSSCLSLTASAWQQQGGRWIQISVKSL